MPMPGSSHVAERNDCDWLRSAVADCLEMSPLRIDPARPFVQYGLDSIGALQLAFAIADHLGIEAREDLVVDCPDLASLERYVGELVSNTKVPAPATCSEWELMLADSRLPADVIPELPPNSAIRDVLLTGASGFLGAFLLKELLEEKGRRVYCLVRDRDGATAYGRLYRSLVRFGLWQDQYAGRIKPVLGDLIEPNLGLSSADYTGLCRKVGAVYHAAAQVNWVFPYKGLREANVMGTLEVVRFACRGPAKALHFVSSLAVCYSTTAPEAVSELDDPLRHLDGLPFGYAQSKCIAENLIQQASERGLTVSIHRPGLLTGATRSGAGSGEDFLALFLNGCIAMGLAPDLDWRLDASPVDTVACAIVKLGHNPGAGSHVFHLSNPAARSWREAVLWLNLYGYEVRLLPYVRWLERLRDEAAAAQHPLHFLRSFFTRPVDGHGRTVPELYEQGQCPEVRCASTHHELAERGIAWPRVDAPLLERWFGALIQQGALPAVSCPRAPTQARRPALLDRLQVQATLRESLQDPSLLIKDARVEAIGADHSLLTELTSWNSAATGGLARWTLLLESRGNRVPTECRVFVKQKPGDIDVIRAGTALARACSQELGSAFARGQHLLGLIGCHKRELEMYRLPDARLRALTPGCHGIIEDDQLGTWTLLLEDLSGMPLLDCADDSSGWGLAEIEAVLRGSAQIHSLCLGRQNEMPAWLGVPMTAATMQELTPLWQALADHAARFFVPWMGEGVRILQERLIDTIPEWWGELESQPHTLIHNDFNPRNIALRPTPAGPTLCAFDWELATWGVPQHDVAEFLCFVLPHDTRRPTVEAYLELHRHALAEATGRRISRTSWERGFVLALADLFVNRLAMYTMAHTFRRLPYLERVMRNWERLYSFFKG
jgi:thioester reductase-like protein